MQRNYFVDCKTGLLAPLAHLLPAHGHSIDESKKLLIAHQLVRAEFGPTVFADQKIAEGSIGKLESVPYAWSRER